ncbi:PREDICTED: melanoregulin-like [Crocodylus porosus]|uniref:melanoregulin-like n=1 Tax=Crocodylus porosus TaxID=8502 RepID=UPI00093DDFA0|nr:PREDICTED: melanoregulin-like [Crocodylus porosus]
MDVCLQLFCCCCRQEEPEKNPLIRSETLQYFNQLVKRKRAEATNLWNEPVDSTHMERDDDRELYNLLQKRAKLRRGSEGYRRLSFDISAHRQIRREVKDRWKHILEALGFSAEADGLLTVTSTMSYSSLRHPQQARALLTSLATETSLFDRHCSPPERYLFVLDRLVVLDVGDDFLSAARRYYPLEEDEAPHSEEEPFSEEAILVTLSPGPELPKGVEEEEEEEEEVAEEVDEDTLLAKLME